MIRTTCELIEQVPGKVSGKPVVRDTRVMPGPIMNSYELGDSIDEIHEGFLSPSVIELKRLIDFAYIQFNKEVGSDISALQQEP